MPHFWNFYVYCCCWKFEEIGKVENSISSDNIYKLLQSNLNFECLQCGNLSLETNSFWTKGFYFVWQLTIDTINDFSIILFIHVMIVASLYMHFAFWQWFLFQTLFYINSRGSGFDCFFRQSTVITTIALGTILSNLLFLIFLSAIVIAVYCDKLRPGWDGWGKEKF